jgi:hypothetical protein
VEAYVGRSDSESSGSKSGPFKFSPFELGDVMQERLPFGPYDYQHDDTMTHDLAISSFPICFLFACASE